MSENKLGQVITAGYERDCNYNVIYHDLYDLYGPMIGPDGMGLWVTYKRFVMHSEGHLLYKKAWPSQRRLAKVFHTGQTTLKTTRVKLERADLLTVTKGSELARRSREEYDQQLLVWHAEGKPRKTIRQISLSDLFEIGIQHPANSLFIEVNDPLTLLGFCDEFNLTYRPVFKHGKWEMEFEDYTGELMGANRLMAAARYIEENLSVSAADRPYQPMVTEEQILSLLRCRLEDAETISIRNRLLQRRAELAGEPTPGSVLPENILAGLQQLGWQGSYQEVEEAFRTRPQQVAKMLLESLSAARRMYDGEKTVENPAGLFRSMLHDSPSPRRELRH